MPTPAAPGESKTWFPTKKYTPHSWEAMPSAGVKDEGCLDQQLRFFSVFARSSERDLGEHGKYRD